MLFILPLISFATISGEMKMKKISMVVAGLAMVFGASQILAEGAAATKDVKAVAKAKKPQTMCPVMGGKINKKLFVDADGKRIYVCCSDCIAEVRKDPKKYIKMLEDQGIALDKTPVKKTAKK